MSEHCDVILKTGMVSGRSYFSHYTHNS